MTFFLLLLPERESGGKGMKVTAGVYYFIGAATAFGDDQTR